MRIPNLGETDLLVPLHDGVFEQPMWQTFLARLRSAAGCGFAGIALRSVGEDEWLRLASGDARWSEAVLGPLIEFAPALRAGRVYSGAELGGVNDFDLRAIRVGGADEFTALFAVANDDPLGGGTGGLLAALAPHLRVALRVLGAIERERARSAMSTQALARMNFGWIALDAKCRIVDLDDQAERLLGRNAALGRSAYDRLTPTAPEADRQLAQLVRGFADDPGARPRALNLSRDPWLDMLVAPLRMARLASGLDAVAVAYLRGDRSSSADRHEQLGELFDLTPSEARLAWSMAQGLTIAQAAAEHGLTIETARNYSKKIYAKTGARGQVDLVRHVQAGVLALA